MKQDSKTFTIIIDYRGSMLVAGNSRFNFGYKSPQVGRIMKITSNFGVCFE